MKIDFPTITILKKTEFGERTFDSEIRSECNVLKTEKNLNDREDPKFFVSCPNRDPKSRMQPETRDCVRDVRARIELRSTDPIGEILEKIKINAKTIKTNDINLYATMSTIQF